MNENNSNQDVDAGVADTGSDQLPAARAARSRRTRSSA